MKKFFTLLTLLVCSIIFSATQTKASHVMGSDITWKCLPDGKFEITVTVYRDCNGIQLSPQDIGLQPIDCPGYTSKVNLSTTKGDPWDITPLCKKTCTRCSTGPDANGNGGSPPGSGSGCAELYGIEQHVYKAVVDLSNYPPACCKFKLSWGQCCRNSAITTGAGGADFYVEAELNRCVKPCDNSPQFTNPPLAIYCINHPQTFNMGVNDPDIDAAGRADSLRYYFTDPLSGPGSPIPYTGGFKKDKPLRFDGWPNPDAAWNPPSYKGFHLDSLTGDLQFKATKVDVTVFSIVIESWGKDAFGKPVLKSVSRRDMQIVITACPSNKPPQLTGINGGSTTEDHFCVGQQKCFNINSFDPDKKDSLTVNWNRGIPGATFTIEKNKKHPRSQFCWTPGPEHVRSYPYTFVVNAADDACPVNGRTTRSFRIYVHPTPVPVVDTNILKCGWVEYSAKSATPGSGYSFTWSGDDGLSGNTGFAKHHYKDPGLYRWAVTIKKTYGKVTCESTDTGHIVIKPYVNIDLPRDTAVCYGTVISKISAKTSLGGDPTPPFNKYTYRWSTGKTGNGETNNGFIENLTITKDTAFWVEVYDQVDKCYNWDTIYVKSKAWPKPVLDANIRKCEGELVILDPKITEAKSTFEWVNTAKPGVVISKQKLLTVSESGDYQVTVKDSLGCTGTAKVRVDFNPMVDVHAKVVPGCVGDPITVSGGVGGTGVDWEWRDMLNSFKLVAKTKDFTFTPNAAGDRIYYVKASQTMGGVTCMDEDTIIVSVNRKPSVTLRPVPAQCVNGGPLDLNAGNFATPPGGQWTMAGNSNAVVSNILYPDKAGYKQGAVDTLKYTYIDFTTGCKTVIPTTVLIDTVPKVVTKDTILCATDAPINLNNELIISASPTGAGAKYVWSGEGVTQSGTNWVLDPASPGPINRVLTLKYTSPTGGKCEATNFVNVTIVPKVTVLAGNYGPLCINSNPINLGGTPVSGPQGQGVWKVAPGGNTAMITTSNGVTTFNPLVAGVGAHKLIYEFSMNGRCMRSDETEIIVNNIPDVDLTAEKNRVCIDGENVKLIGMVNGSPAIGGTYTAKNGSYVAGNYFRPSVANKGVNWVYFTYQDFNTKCINMDSVSIIVDDTIGARILPTAIVCAGNPITLQVDTYNVQTLTWSAEPADPTASFSNPNSTTTTFKPGQNHILSGVFKVKVTVTPKVSGTQCQLPTPERTISINPKPVPGFYGNTTGCEPHTVQFIDTTLGNNINWRWDFGDGTTLEGVKNPVHTYQKAGVQPYTVKLTVTNFQGCDSTVIYPNYINVLPKPVAEFTATPSYTTITLPKVKFTNLSTKTEFGTKYFWDFGDGFGSSVEKDPEYSYRDTGIFTVKLRVVNPNGCEDEKIKIDTISIRPEMLVFIPNAFSPNRLFNDRTIRNEEFTVEAMDYGSFEMTIFNRWGEELYYTTDRLKGWDGTYRSAPVQEGVYMYVVKLTSLTGKKYKYTGSVTLLR